MGEEFSENNRAPLRRATGASVTADAYGRYAFTNALGTTTPELGVNNVANSSYVAVYNGFYATSDATTYDLAGRFGYVRITQKF